MKLVLEIVSGPATGQCFAIERNRTVTFGRTDAANYSLPDDNYLSRQHFSVRFDQEGFEWQIRDLESRHGTSVNGERITQVSLNEGDEIMAGQSVFCARVASEEESSPEALAIAAAALVMFTATVASQRPPTRPPSFERARCHTGLITLIGTDADPAPASIAWLLAKRKRMYLIADFVKAAMPFPKQLEKRDYLFNWADEEVLEAFSPVLLSPDDPVDPFEIIDALWGHDAVVCVFSSSDKAQVLTQLRSAVRGDDGLRTTVPKALAGFCWPEAARPLLITAPQRLIGSLLNSEAAYLMEAELPRTWQLFVQKDQESEFKKALEV